MHIVLESGCGKSTLVKAIIGLEPSAGSIRCSQKELNRLPASAKREARKNIQMIFQDPLSSLDLRMTLGWVVLVARPLKSCAPH